VVGEIQYCRERYGDSFVRFLTEPELTVYMPAEGPSRFPSSHFWRVQAVVRSAGHGLHDLERGPRPQPEEAVDWVRAPLRAKLLAALWIFALLNWVLMGPVWSAIGGDPLQTRPSVDGLVLEQYGRRTAVGQARWLFSLIYMSASLIVLPLLVGVGAARHAKRMPKGTEAEQANAGVAWLFVAACALWCFVIGRAAVVAFLDWYWYLR
jgi:hypothetical protein